MNLHDLPKLKGVNRKKKRIGRGYGSGKGGHTSTRGMKGQKARNKVRIGFEGGQNPLYKSLPQARGFKPLNKVATTVVNVRDLERKFKVGDEITKDSLRAAGLIGAKDEIVKVLATGECKKKFVIKGIRVSKSAKEKIEAAGGEVK